MEDVARDWLGTIVGGAVEEVEVVVEAVDATPAAAEIAVPVKLATCTLDRFTGWANDPATGSCATP